MKALTALAAAFCLALVLIACGGDDSEGDASTTAASSTESAPTTSPAGDGSTVAPGVDEVAVDIADFAFDPDEIQVAVGGTVTWTNADDQQHTATGSGTFDTGAIAAGSSASFTFEAAGEVSFICSFHPFMKGTVVVG